jgi:hypothetical protein
MVFVRELAWFEAADEHVLATLIEDTDGEFSGIILARDLRERFRCVGTTTGCFETPEQALADLHRTILSLLPNLRQERRQGDESGKVIDFFAPLVDEKKLHPRFRKLASGDRYSAAREIISAMMRWYEDVDGNFIQQFQTTGFDARVWELYLFAALTEANLKITRPKPAPDFLARGLNGEFALEATTINPGRDDGQPIAIPSRQTDEERETYVRHYLPIKYAGPFDNKTGQGILEQALSGWEAVGVRDSRFPRPAVDDLQPFPSGHLSLRVHTRDPARRNRPPDCSAYRDRGTQVEHEGGAIGVLLATRSGEYQRSHLQQRRNDREVQPDGRQRRVRRRQRGTCPSRTSLGP